MVRASISVDIGGILTRIGSFGVNLWLDSFGQSAGLRDSSALLWGIIYGKEYRLREAKTSWNRFETPPNARKRKLYTQHEKVSQLFYLFPLFWSVLYDRYIPIQTLIVITLLCNVMLMVPRELGLPVDFGLNFSKLSSSLYVQNKKEQLIFFRYLFTHQLEYQHQPTPGSNPTSSAIISTL